MKLTRRDLLKIGATAGLATALDRRDAKAWSRIAERWLSQGLIERPIPSSGELLPVVGIGTARRYDATTPEDRAPLAETLRLFAEMGGKVIDTAPSYGAAEVVLGDLMEELGLRDRLFLATKVAPRTVLDAANQIGLSFQRMKTEVIDLIQVHNLRGVDLGLNTLSELKARGRIRYTGMTTSSLGQYEDFERYMKAKDVDFVQVNFSLEQREAEERLLPLAIDRGMAVLINLPYGRGRLFQAVGDRSVPEWAAEWGIESWGQFFLKYIISHPAVTCVIPGTHTVEYLVDNLGAARGELPDEATRRRMAQFFEQL